MKLTESLLVGVCSIYDRADEIKALHAAGHTLGSHSWSHPNLATLLVFVVRLFPSRPSDH